MQVYSEYAPTGFDSKGLGLEDRQDWIVVCGKNRDSKLWEECNFDAAVSMLGGEGEDVEIHRFGHWACGWLEIVMVRPGTEAANQASKIEASLENYPLLDEDDYNERVFTEAQEVWKTCYNNEDRLAYIRKRRSDFEFSSFADLMGCVRGSFFCGDYVSLIEGY